MKRIFSTLFILCCLLTVSSAAKKARKTEVNPKAVELRVENVAEPLGIATNVPRFSWQIIDSKQNSMQQAYRILVASEPDLLAPGKADLWDSNTVQSDQSLWVNYAGKALKDNQYCYWTVQVTTTNGTSAWTAPQRFSIGLTADSHWKGRWIGIDNLLEGEVLAYKTRINARYLRSEMPLKADKTIKRATAFIGALGLYELYINGKRQGTDVLAPSQTDTRKSIIYNTFDITESLTANPQSSFAVGVILGNGHEIPMRYHKHYKIPFLGYPKCRMTIIVEYTDGTQESFGTTEKWRATANGPIRSNNEYDGEVYDARLDLGNWASVGYDDSKWMKAERADIPQGELHGQTTPNMSIIKVIKPVSVKKSKNGFIVDFGQNTAGWVQLNMRGNSGDTIKIKYAERLDTDGSLYIANLRDAETEDRYICSGKENGTPWHSTFSYHGFRYVEVKGMNAVAAADLEAHVVSDRMDCIGSITTSNSILNRVYQNAWWGILSNYKSFPVDCPQRNERQPWLGDRVMGCLGESFLFNNERLYTKWMRDICESQRSDGVFCDVAPAYWTYYNDDITWPSALPFGCEMIYNQFGNKEPIIASYPALKKWVAHVVGDYMTDGIITKDQYGDWCVPPEDLKLIHSKDPARQTDGTLISTAYMIRNMRLMQQYADIAGHPEDKAYYAALEKEMTAAFNRTFLTIKRGTSPRPGHVLYPDSVFYGNNTATANLLPLALGIVPADCKDDVVKNIVTNIITKNNGHVSCGVIGISWLMRGLSDNGFADVAFLLASSKSYPSWGYMAEQGATTIWELWNGNTANPAMNSGNHVMILGDLLPWYYQYLGGIRNAQGSVAYKHLTLRPSFEIQELDNVDASYMTPYGKVVSKWTKTLEKVHWDVEIPANTTADVYLPDGTMKTIGSGRYTFDTAIPLPKGINCKVTDDEFVYKQTDYPETHSASIVELKNGDLVATYFGGTKERTPDVCIWTQIKKKGSDQWSEPVLAGDGVFRLGTADAALAGIDENSTPATKGYIKLKEARKAMPKFQYSAKGAATNGKSADDEQEELDKRSDVPNSKDGKGDLSVWRRKACWNPVLFEMPSGELWLFYKIGLKVADWTGWVVKSKDGGKTWSEREPLQKGFIGPVKNKPVLIGDRLICPSSTEGNGWKFHFEILDMKTGEWKYVGPIEREEAAYTGDGKMKPIDCIQPSILLHKDGRLQAVGRTRNGKLASTFSSDNGDTWSKVTLIDVPQNQSGTDAVTLQDGRHVLIYNNFSTLPGTPKGPRTPCSLAISEDGIHWKHFLTLEDSPISQYSYPSIIQGKDGSLHCIYTWRRQRIAYKRVELE